MTKNYKEVKNKIFWSKFKGWTGTSTKWILTTAGLALVGIGTLIVGLGNASQKGAEQAKTYSENKFAEVETLKEEAQKQKEVENKEWVKDLNDYKDEELKVEENEDGYCVIS